MLSLPRNLLPTIAFQVTLDVMRPGREQSREASSHVERDENQSAMRARLDRAGRGHETANARILSGNQYAVLFENDEE